MSIQHDMNEIIVVEHPSSWVATRINDRLGTISSSFPKPTIFKVHAMLRRENEMAYEPKVLAIGPYHRGKDRLQVMEDRKLRWFKANLEKLEECDSTKYVEAMRKLEPEARQCYSESTENINDDEFVEMLLLDGCFIIQIMRWCLSDIKTTDPFFQDWAVNSSIRDMLLFENQIPLFVLEDLYSMIKLPGEPNHFYKFALEFLTGWLRSVFRMPIDTMFVSCLQYNTYIEHILGLSHYILRSQAAVKEDHTHYLQTKAKWISQLCETKVFKFIKNQLRWLRIDQHNINAGHKDDGMKFEFIPCATELHAVGVEFRKKKVTSNPFEINFKNGVMEIPTFKIGGMERFYRNLIAYELYNKGDINHFAGRHAKLMDCLIESADDVALLRSFGIVGGFLGEDDLFSSIYVNKVQSSMGSDESKAQMAKLFQDVNAYYGKRRHKWMAKLRRDYFSSPWAWISFLAAVLLLLLTLTQTVFSILGGV